MKKKPRKSATMRALDKTVRLLRQMTEQRFEVAHADGERFVTICVGPAGNGSVMYGLDGNGQVWRYHYREGVWSPTSMTRVAQAPDAARPGGERT